MREIGFSKLWHRRRGADSARSIRNLYALQRRIGFSWLRFLQPLESEYQAAQLSVVVARSWRLYLLAVLALIGAVGLNRLSGGHFLSPRGEWIGVGTAVALAFPFFMLIRHGGRPRFRFSLQAAFYIYAIGVVSATLVSRADGAGISETGIALVTLAGYFVSSMRLLEAIGYGLAVVVFVVVGSIWLKLPDSDLAVQVFFLGFTNLLGLLGYYYFDYNTRLNFLLRSELEELAYCDPLTGLLNRRAFYRHLRSVWRQAERVGCPVGVAVIDMDGLKTVNDRRGHREGDRSLRLIGEVLGGFAQRPLDGIARIGGDEFAGVWFDVDEAWFAALPTALRERLREASEAHGIPVVSVSVGVCCRRPSAGTNPLEALNEADAAMYRAKHGHHDGAG